MRGGTTVLETLRDLPAGVDGIRATGTVTKEDYDTVLRPLLEVAHRGRRIRLLYQFAPEFRGFTPGAGLEDVRLGLKYLRLFERCAVVSDVGWIRDGVRLLGTMMPCPVKVFGNAQWREAVDWVSAPIRGTVPHRLLTDAGVLVVEPTQPLGAEDFDALAATVDPWIEAEGRLRGIVIHTRGFPGWQNIGSFLRHVRFVRDHHRKVGRIALAADGVLADMAPTLADPFVQAEVRRFDYDRLDDAIRWAGAVPPGRKPA
jgi:hypothetical protein